MMPLVVAWAGFAMLGFGLKSGLSLVIEAVAFLLLLLNCLRYEAFRSLPAAMNRDQRLITAGLIGLLLTGQIAGDKHLTYPFVDWTMYCEPHPPSHYYEYTAELASGETLPYPFMDIAPTRAATQFSSRFNELFDNALASVADSPPLNDLKIQLRQLAERYNRRHPETPIRAIQVKRKMIHIEALRRGEGQWETEVPVLRAEVDET